MNRDLYFKNTVVSGEKLVTENLNAFKKKNPSTMLVHLFTIFQKIGYQVILGENPKVEIEEELFDALPVPEKGACLSAFFDFAKVSSTIQTCKITDEDFPKPPGIGEIDLLEKERDWFAISAELYELAMEVVVAGLDICCVIIGIEHLNLSSPKGKLKKSLDFFNRNASVLINSLEASPLFPRFSQGIFNTLSKYTIKSASPLVKQYNSFLSEIFRFRENEAELIFYRTYFNSGNFGSLRTDIFETLYVPREVQNSILSDAISEFAFRELLLMTTDISKCTEGLNHVIMHHEILQENGYIASIFISNKPWSKLSDLYQNASFFTIHCLDPNADHWFIPQTEEFKSILENYNYLGAAMISIRQFEPDSLIVVLENIIKKEDLSKFEKSINNVSIKIPIANIYDQDNRLEYLQWAADRLVSTG